MAIARLSVKVGKTGKAAPHAAYIARTGQYASRLEKGERLEATEAGNLPAWAQADPVEFWKAADAHERANGTTYREFEIALPRELSQDERAALVREFIRQELGERHAYQWAIHCPTAADGQAQPHAHVMFSERQRDGIERDPAHYFKRYNAKAPEKGGAKKGWGEKAGQTLSREERAADLKALRQRWEQACNAALEQAGQAERIDMRSHAERGLETLPEKKFLPSEWRTWKAEVIEFRQARAELARTVPDLAGEIISLEERRRKAERQPPDSLAGFRASVERAEAAGGLALDVAKAQLAVAQEFQADGKDPRHHIGAIMREGQQRAFDDLQEPSQANKAEPLVQASNQTRPESPLEAQYGHEIPPVERDRAGPAVPRPGSIKALAGDLARIDRALPIERQAEAFFEIGDRLANWRSQKASHASSKATQRYWRRYKKQCDAQQVCWKAKPTGLLGVFKQKAYEAASAAYQRAQTLHDQAAALSSKLEDVAKPEAVKKWAWAMLAKAAPDLTERMKAHQQETERQRREQAWARERERRQKQGQHRGPRR